MKNQRPKIKTPVTTFDYTLEFISILLILLCLAYTFVSWNQLPERIPIHFNFAGQADGFGHKNNLLFLPIIPIILYLGLTLLTKYPHIFNYIVEITENNAAKQYQLAKRLLSSLKIEIILLFTYIQISSILSAKTGTFSIGLWFLPVILVVVFGTLGVYIYKSINKK